MGAISKLLGAGLKKVTKKTEPKMDIKKYQEGIAKRALKNRKKQILELKDKIATTKDSKELAKLQSQLDNAEKYAAKNKQSLGLGGPKKNNLRKFEKAFNKDTGTATDNKGFEKRIDKAKRMVEAGTGKRKKVKQGKKVQETTEELLKKAKNIETFKEQAD